MQENKSGRLFLNAVYSMVQCSTWHIIGHFADNLMGQMTMTQPTALS